jgi:hypothetical protein
MLPESPLSSPAPSLYGFCPACNRDPYVCSSRPAAALQLDDLLPEQPQEQQLEQVLMVLLDL